MLNHRFKLPHAWAWNDDVIYIEQPQTNTENLTKYGKESMESRTNGSSSSVDNDYGQNRYLGVEGVEDYILSKDEYHEPRKPNTR